MTWLIVAVAAYLLAAVTLALVQHRLIFPGGNLPTMPGAKAAAPGLEELWFDVPGGSVEAWYLPPAGATEPAPALLFTHGNAELIDQWVAEFRAFADRGIGVLLLEYPGYGRSTGTPTYRAVRASALAAYDWLADRPEIDASRIVPFGRSVGGGPACLVARDRRVPALILHSTFVSLRPFARRFLMPGWLIRVPFENLDVVRDFDGPVLLVHGRRDLVVPYWHGRRLAEAARDPVLLSYDSGHNDCPPSWDRHVDDVLDFLEGAGVSSRP